MKINKALKNIVSAGIVGLTALALGTACSSGDGLNEIELSLIDVPRDIVTSDYFYGKKVRDTHKAVVGDRVYEITVFEFDSLGRLTKSSFDTDADGRIDETRFSEYDSKGNITRRVYSYERDSQGREVRRKIDYEGDGVVDRTISHTYDAQGRLSEIGETGRLLLESPKK